MCKREPLGLYWNILCQTVKLLPTKTLPFPKPETAAFVC